MAADRGLEQLPVQPTLRAGGRRIRPDSTSSVPRPSMPNASVAARPSRSGGAITRQAGAAPNPFTFLRYPGMPPTNHPTERDMRDAVVVQRKIRHKFVNSGGMRVFSAIQGFNSTCRKMGLVPWKCIAQIATDHAFNIFRVGPELVRASAPWNDTITARHEACVDGTPVKAPAGGWDAYGIARLAAGVPDTEPEAVPDTIDTADMDESASLEAAYQSYGCTWAAFA